MSIFTTPEQREAGRANFDAAVRRHAVSRRDFMKGLLAAGAAVPVTAAAYYGYQKWQGNPVKAGLIGAGDEGGVLVGEHNKDYLDFVAYSDIRPSNQTRIFSGDPQGGLRKGFNYHYGSQARQRITRYEDYEHLLDDPKIEM